jgi:hypothetical protein
MEGSKEARHRKDGMALRWEAYTFAFVVLSFLKLHHLFHSGHEQTNYVQPKALQTQCIMRGTTTTVSGGTAGSLAARQ